MYIKRLAIMTAILSISLMTGWGRDRLEEVAAGKARIVDLTYALDAQTPYWPGGQYEPFKLETIATIKADGVLSMKMAFPEHIGTHLDAPNHFVEGKPSVDAIPPEQLFGPAIVVDVSAPVKNNPDYQVSVADLRQWEKAHGKIPDGAIVFARTGWDQYWTRYDRYKNQDDKGTLHFPGFAKEAAEFLVRERHIKGIGIDTLSVDYGPSKDFIVHHITHGAGKYHIENVANLDKLPPKGAFVIVAPIKVRGGSGGPARVWAILDK